MPLGNRGEKGHCPPLPLKPVYFVLGKTCQMEQNVNLNKYG
jgi:hypothetical protein